MLKRYPYYLGLSLMAGLMASALSASAALQHTQSKAFMVAQVTSSISEAEVNQLLGKMVAAAKSKNAKQLVSYFLPDASIELTLPPEMGSKQTLKPAAYKKMLKAGWAALSQASYTYEVKNIQFKLYPEKSMAAVYGETHESFVLNGEKIQAVAQQYFLVVRHQGQLKIKTLRAKAK